MFPIHPVEGSVPLLNSACPWATDEHDLKQLWECEHTAAVTTRTTTLHGFPDDGAQHQVVFFDAARSSANSFGYSPHPLSDYLRWLRPLVQRDGPRKQIVVSIGGTLQECSELLKRLQAFADEMKIIVAAEFNASCPNLPGHPPPAYSKTELVDALRMLAEHASSTLRIGVKLPPYTYEGQFLAVIDALSIVSPADKSRPHPVSFLTATNTLGQGLVFSEQISNVERDLVSQGAKASLYALPGGYGGLAGTAVHQLSLGNVARLSHLLRHGDDPSLRSVTLIGVGGVHDAAGVERFRAAGASAVAVATALGREGISVFAKMAAAPMSKL